MQDAPDLFVDLDGIDPQVVFAKGGAEAVIAGIEEAAREAATSDLSTATARGAIAAVAFKVARTKVALDDRGKAHVAHLKEQAKEVDGERKAIRDRLDVLRDSVRKPLTDWEDAENRRIEEHQQALAEIENLAVFDSPEPAAADIQDRIDRLSRIGGNRDWQEFEGRAKAAREAAKKKLEWILVTAERREKERAELEALRKSESERVERERIAKAAEAAASKIRLEAAADVAAANRRADNAVAEARQKIEADQAEATKAAAAHAGDREHRAKINAAVRHRIMSFGITAEIATEVVKAIVRGEIANVTITY